MKYAREYCNKDHGCIMESVVYFVDPKSTGLLGFLGGKVPIIEGGSWVMINGIK